MRKDVRVRDGERRRITRRLPDSDTLQTGQDFKDAAFILQHRDAPQDYLTAHILAMAAKSKGDASARWIAAAQTEPQSDENGSAR